MLKQAMVVARFTLLEAARARLPRVALATIASGLVLAECAAGLALTDSQSYRLDVYAAWTRIALVACTVLFVASSVVRELADRAIDVSLARPLSRGAWFVGRLTGYCAGAALLATAAALPLAFTATPLAALVWGFSLAAELSLVAAASLSSAVALTQVPAAVLAVAGFYVLSRSIDAMVLMSTGPTVAPGAWSALVIERVVGWLALLLPPLATYTRSSWLLDASTALAALPAIVAQTVIYAMLLTAVGMFDFARREI